MPMRCLRLRARSDRTGSFSRGGARSAPLHRIFRKLTISGSTHIGNSSQLGPIGGLAWRRKSHVPPRTSPPALIPVPRIMNDDRGLPSTRNDLYSETLGRTPPPSDHPRLHAGSWLREKSGLALSHSGSWSAASSSWAGWSAATATYFAFHDDVLTRLIARQAQMQYAYEDRIADLRASSLTAPRPRANCSIRISCNRSSTRYCTNDRRRLTRQRSCCNRRASPTLPPPARSNHPDATQSDGLAHGSAIPKPSPINDTVIFAAPPDREARLGIRRTVGGDPAAEPVKSGTFRGWTAITMIGRMQRSLDNVENEQVAALTSVEEGKTILKYAAWARSATDLGLDMAKLQAATPRPVGVGGPFIPVKPPSATACSV